MGAATPNKKILDETFGSTDKKGLPILFISSINKRVLANDTASNKKYKEKIVEVSGNIVAVEIAADLVGTICFEDSTGSFASFTLEKNQFPNIQSLKAGDAVVIKGVCSGSIFSEILNNTQISFKRSGNLLKIKNKNETKFLFFLYAGSYRYFGQKNYGYCQCKLMIPHQKMLYPKQKTKQLSAPLTQKQVLGHLKLL